MTVAEVEIWLAREGESVFSYLFVLADFLGKFVLVFHLVDAGLVQSEEFRLVQLGLLVRDEAFLFELGEDVVRLRELYVLLFFVLGCFCVYHIRRNIQI